MYMYMYMVVCRVVFRHRPPYICKCMYIYSYVRICIYVYTRKKISAARLLVGGNVAPCGRPEAEAQAEGRLRLRLKQADAEAEAG